METKTLTFRKAAASDLDAVTAIYDRLHAQEDAGRVTIGWVTGVYPIRFDAEQALARGDLYVCGSEGLRRGLRHSQSEAGGRLHGGPLGLCGGGQGCFRPAHADRRSRPLRPGHRLLRSCNSMRIRRERWAALCCGWIPTKKTRRAALIRAARLPGRRTSCRARSTAFRMCGSCCSKRSYNF